MSFDSAPPPDDGKVYERVTNQPDVQKQSQKSKDQQTSAIDNSQAQPARRDYNPLFDSPLLRGNQPPLGYSSQSRSQSQPRQLTSQSNITGGLATDTSLPEFQRAISSAPSTEAIQRQPSNPFRQQASMEQPGQQLSEGYGNALVGQVADLHLDSFPQPGHPQEQLLSTSIQRSSYLDSNIPSAAVPDESQDLIDLRSGAGSEPDMTSQPPASAVAGLQTQQQPAARPLQSRTATGGPPSIPTGMPRMPSGPPETSALKLPQQEREKKLKETYDIKHISWKKSAGSALQRVHILVQNKNGPCPLLALVNAIVLLTGPGTGSPLVKALESREQISLGLLIQAMFEELITIVHEDLPDIEELSSFLTILHSGMNVNPCLIPDCHPTPRPGYFQETSDLRLYGSFNIPLVHGWLAAPQTNAYKSLKQLAQYYEDIELLQIENDEYTYRILKGETLSSNEEARVEGIQHILSFTNIENPTQMSPFGLEHLKKTLDPGSVSILFRNNHFATMYKNPDSQNLFLLVSDAGFSSRPEIVWESLVDVTGNQTNYFSGDFLPVGGHENPRGVVHRGDFTTEHARAATDGNRDNDRDGTEQEDADYAYALQLRYEEMDEAYRREQAGRTGASSTSSRRPRREGDPPPPSYEQSRFDPEISDGSRQERRAGSVSSAAHRSEGQAHVSRAVPQTSTASAGTGRSNSWNNSLARSHKRKSSRECAIM